MQAEAIISNDTTPIILRTEWYESYEGTVQGALQASAAPRSMAPCSLASWLRLILLLSQAACQESPMGQCVAICIDGGMLRAVKNCLNRRIGAVVDADVHHCAQALCRVWRRGR